MSEEASELRALARRLHLDEQEVAAIERAVVALDAQRAALDAVRDYADFLTMPATRTGTPSVPSRWFPSPKMTIADDLRDILRTVEPTL